MIKNCAKSNQHFYKKNISKKMYKIDKKMIKISPQNDKKFQKMIKIGPKMIF